MREKGFGFIGLIITIAIIAVMVFGYMKINGDSQKNQVESGQDAINQAKDAAEQERQDNLRLQGEVDGLQPDLAPSTYHDIENRAKNLSQ